MFRPLCPRLGLPRALGALLLAQLLAACPGDGLIPGEPPDPIRLRLKVLLTVPAQGASGQPRQLSLHADFDTALDGASLTPGTFTLETGGVPVAGTVRLEGDRQAVLTPSAPLAYGTTYTATLTTAVVGRSGATLAEPVRWTFTTAAPPPPDTVQGQVTYDSVIPVLVGERTARLDHERKQRRPARRVQVQALDGAGNVVASATTDDEGRYSLSVPDGTQVTLRARARSESAGNSRDGIAPDRCAGAAWSVSIVDNTQGQALYVLDGAAPVASPESGVILHAALQRDPVQPRYTARQAAPFAVLDTVISGLERVCEGQPDVALPPLDVHWSPRNTPFGTTHNPASGAIRSPHYLRNAEGRSQIYLMGHENVDTDEFDGHIILHELGHFLEDRLYRADNIGGGHPPGAVLDPRLAFGEGFADAFAAMTFDEPLIINTAEYFSTGGHWTSMALPPADNDRGVYSQASVRHLLWSLYENRDATPRSGSYQRIHGIMAGPQRTSAVLTSLHSFVAFYNAAHGGDAEGLRTLWSQALDSPYDALCVGSCTGTGDATDLVDTDNDLGRHYAGARTYNDTRQDAEFWRLYRPLPDGGIAAPGTGHEQILGSRSSNNRLGAQRWYLYMGTGQPRSFTLGPVGGSGCPEGNLLDVLVQDRGNQTRFESSSSCEAFTVPGEADRPYVIVVYAPGNTDVSGWGITPGPGLEPLAPEARGKPVAGGEVQCLAGTPLSGPPPSPPSMGEVSVEAGGHRILRMRDEPR